MQHILLVSDSHGNDDAVYDVLDKYIEWADIRIHCGDICSYDNRIESDFLCVRGNNDYNGEPLERIINIEQRKIWVTHGTRYTDFANQTRLVAKAKTLGVDTVFYGHTHNPKILNVDNIVLINPGSLRYNRDGSGTSYALISVDGKKIDATIEYIKPEKQGGFWF